MELTGSQIFRLCFNFIGALALILVPLAYDRLTTTELYGVALGIIWAILIVNVVGILPSKTALKARSHHIGGAVEAERGVMIEEGSHYTFMPDSNLSKVYSRSSHRHPEAVSFDGANEQDNAARAFADA